MLCLEDLASGFSYELRNLLIAFMLNLSVRITVGAAGISK
jgi:hypothetical protein